MAEITNTSGRRKTAVARIYLSEGTGNCTINGTGNEGKYDVKANLDGGGITGQAEALRLAISKALIEINPEWKSILRTEGLTTRDPRMVERKKFGQKKARKRFQFSKR